MKFIPDLGTWTNYICLGFSTFHAICSALIQLPSLAEDDSLGGKKPQEKQSQYDCHPIQDGFQVGLNIGEE